MSLGPASTSSVRGPVRRGALLACLLLLLPAAYVQAGADEHSVAWSVPAGTDIAVIESRLANTAQSLLDGDAPEAMALTRDQRIHLQIVAGRNAQAAASIESTMALLVEQGEDVRAQRWMPYLLRCTSSYLSRQSCS